MKKLILSIATLILFSSLSAQVIYHRTSNPNIGFGKVTKSNQFLDFVVNGPLVLTDGSPVGGYIDNTVMMKNWMDPAYGVGNFAVDNTIFGFGTDGRFYMVPFSLKDSLPIMKWAFQNGPVLVKGGVNVRGTSQSKFARSGIGYKKDGTLVAIISLTPVTFYEFANLFVQENCLNAVYLDGGPYVGCEDKDGSHGTMVADATKLQFFNN